MNWPTLIEEFIRYQETIGRAVSTLENHRINLTYWQKYLTGQACQVYQAESMAGGMSLADAAEGGASTAKGGTSLAEVTPQIAAGFQAWVYNYRTRFGRPFTIGSQIRILNSLQVFYRYLVKTGKVLNNPAETIRLPKDPQRLPAVVLSPREMKRLLAQPDTSTVLGFRDRTLYEMLYSTGLRIGEMIGLRVQDINLAEGLLVIRCGKGGKERVVPIGATAGRYLVEYLRRVRLVLLRNSAFSAREVLFLDRLGHPFDKSGILKKLALYALRAGIKKRVTVHTFRHTLATEMLRHGADLRQIQELLGHGNLRTTQLYTQIVKGELKRVQAACHPREQIELPEGFIRYRGRKYLTDDERRQEVRSQQP